MTKPCDVELEKLVDKYWDYFKDGNSWNTKAKFRNVLKEAKKQGSWIIYPVPTFSDLTEKEELIKLNNRFTDDYIRLANENMEYSYLYGLVDGEKIEEYIREPKPNILRRIKQWLKV